jgi:hypothetical protein
MRIVRDHVTIDQRSTTCTLRIPQSRPTSARVYAPKGRCSLTCFKYHSWQPLSLVRQNLCYWASPHPIAESRAANSPSNMKDGIDAG